MAYLSDIEIAQSTPMQPITEIAKAAGVDDKYMEQYGRYKAKVDYALLKDSTRTNGKLILVTAITPTPAGEGKTTTTIGLADGLKQIGQNVVAARQAAAMRRSSLWRTSTCISRVTSTPSARRITCLLPCWTTTFIRAIS